MHRAFIVLALLALPALACSFGARTAPTPTFAPPPTDIPPLVVIDARDDDPVPTSTPMRTAQTNTNTNSSSTANCVIRNDWVAYIVVTGDTLSKLAQRTGTTAAALTQANCLANPNLISVGQVLRLPRAPLPPTVTPTLAPSMQTYGDPVEGYAFDYPNGVNVQKSQYYTVVQASNGVLLLEFHPTYSSDLTLDQYIAEWKNAGAGGANLTIISEQPITLPSGVPVVRMILQRQDGTSFVHYWVIVRGRYMTVYGGNNYALADSILYTLRQL